MVTLAMGGNAPIPTSAFSLDVHLPDEVPADVSALVLYASGKVRSDDDMCFYNQTSVKNGALSLAVSAGYQRFSFDLDSLDAEVEKIVVNATLDNSTFGSVSGLKITTSSGLDIPVTTAGRTEAALILCEVYRRNGQWKIRHVAQGFNGGLRALAKHFGVDVDPSGSSTPPVAATPPDTETTPVVNLSKVSLTKNDSTISLKKNDGKYGRIRVNLNWNQSTKSRGFLGMGKKGIDLDLGAFVEFKTGEAGVIQALGDCFGELDKMPFTQLMGDDRSGTSTDGEWMEINGDAWASFKRVLIFAFIYDGVANWQETDGIIRIMVPGQPELEVRMNELDSTSADSMCAVALLENQDNQIHVSREVKFFGGHKLMDAGYGWNMKWRAGSK